MAVKTYSRPMIMLHWLTVLLVAAAFTLVWYGDGGNKELHHQLVGWHKTTGITILVLTLLRLLVRWCSELPAPVRTHALQALAARLVQVGIYLLLLAIPLLGWAMSSAGGHPVSWFGVVDLPSLLAVDKPLSKLLHGLHEKAGLLLLLLVGVHALAAIWHQFWLKDGTLRRMG